MTPERWPDRRPAAVPDDPTEAASDPAGADPRNGLAMHGGVDTDADGHLDTLLTDDGTDLLVLTDLDGDGLADRVLRIGPDGSVHPADAPVPDGAAGPGDVSDAPGRGGSTGSFWGRLLDDLLDPGG